MSMQYLIAYSVIAMIAIVALPLTIRTFRRRKREKLRRRGIKIYEHRGTA